jgi:hypothetical protein
MTIKAYRSSADFLEIISIFQRSQNSIENIVWQNRPSGRLVLNLRQIRYSMGSKKVEVLFDSGGELLDPRDPIYFKLSYRDTIFKAQILAVNKTTLSLQIPKEVKTQELRSHPPRVKVPGDEEFFVLMRLNSLSNSSRLLRQIKVRLIDISPLGLGLAITDNNKNLLRLSESLLIEEIANTQFKSPIEGKMVHLRPLKQKSGLRSIKLSHFGVKLSSFIPKESYEKILAQLRGKNLSFHKFLEVNGLGLDLKNKIKKNQKLILEDFKTNHALNNVHMNLTKALEKQTYFYQHIEMIILTTATLSDALKDQLSPEPLAHIYAAYLHDIPLLHNPNLMRIKNLAEFHLKGSQLSERDQKFFLKSPELAGGFSQKVRWFSPVLKNILFEQKELPEYEGFPQQLNASKIHPHSCLFIIAHDFVDYVLENHSWILSDYLASAKVRYRGGFFPIILKALSEFKTY